MFIFSFIVSHLWTFFGVGGGGQLPACLTRTGIFFFLSPPLYLVLLFSIHVDEYMVFKWFDVIMTSQGLWKSYISAVYYFFIIWYTLIANNFADVINMSEKVRYLNNGHYTNYLCVVSLFLSKGDVLLPFHFGLNCNVNLLPTLSSVS